jgi:hypothetical protein
MSLPILFGSIIRSHGVPVALTLTPEGWRMYAHSHPALDGLRGRAWKTLEDARADLRLAVETSFPRVAGEA